MEIVKKRGKGNPFNNVLRNKFGIDFKNIEVGFVSVGIY